jgi:hypothetical protein
MVHTIEQTLEGKEKGGKQFASIRKSMKRTGQMRQSLRRRTDKADHYFMGHPERGLHLLFAQEKFDESSGDICHFLQCAYLSSCFCSKPCDITCFNLVYATPDVSTRRLILLVLEPIGKIIRGFSQIHKIYL